MIRLLVAAFKFTVVTVVILLVAQIPINNRRICDYVFDVTQSSLIQRPIHWIAERFDFAEGRNQASKAGHVASKRERAASSEHSDSDRDGLSGLLKRRF